MLCLLLYKFMNDTYVHTHNCAMHIIYVFMDVCVHTPCICIYTLCLKIYNETYHVVGHFYLEPVTNTNIVAWARENL